MADKRIISHFNLARKWYKNWNFTALILNIFIGTTRDSPWKSNGKCKCKKNANKWNYILLYFAGQTNLRSFNYFLKRTVFFESQSKVIVVVQRIENIYCISLSTHRHCKYLYTPKNLKIDILFLNNIMAILLRIWYSAFKISMEI